LRAEGSLLYHAQSSNGSFIRQARINPQFGMLLSPRP
jgi:hypothetical protein